MRIIQAGFEVMRPQKMDDASRKAIYSAIEQAGRVCYKTEYKIGEDTAETFIKALVSRGHEAMLEHASLTVRFIVDRGVSHELVRHRLASFAQESTRYCNYAKDQFGSEITVIEPCFWREGSPSYDVWKKACEACEKAYFDLLEIGDMPQMARDVLPTSTKTEVVMTANIREWRHFFKLRALGTTGAPHPQMREVALPLLRVMAGYLPPCSAICWRADGMSNEVKVKEIPFENVMILPPKPGVCRECAVDHRPDQPHNRDSLYYQMKFRQKHGRFPTWWDAMAHCEKHIQKFWIDALAERGVIVELPEETADGESE